MELRASLDHPTAERYSVTVACPNGHSQTVQTSGMTRQMVEDWAGLLDGTSRFYVYPAPPGSMLHRCAICGVQLLPCVISPAE